MTISTLAWAVWWHVIEADSEAESPTSLLWTLSYLAQHFDHSRQTDRALEYINAALDHTMTLIELYVIKARIYKVTLGYCNSVHDVFLYYW